MVRRSNGPDPKIIAFISIQTIVILNEEHRLENLEPEPEPGEPRLEILEA
jgi:hypothetical protein